MPTMNGVETSDATVRLRQLLLEFDEPPAVLVSHNQLMEASAACLFEAQNSIHENQQLVANRILESTKTFCDWETRHALLMREISGEREGGAQRSALLSRALQLIHRKALFEYLRDSQIRGKSRHVLMAHFFGNIDYAQAVVTEHSQYLRSAASFICSSHLGSNLMLDRVFEAPLVEYEALFRAYFKAYCDDILGGDDRPAHFAPLLSLLKQQVNHYRSALLDLAHSRSGVWRRPSFVPKYTKGKS